MRGRQATFGKRRWQVALFALALLLAVGCAKKTPRARVPVPPPVPPAAAPETPPSEAAVAGERPVFPARALTPPVDCGGRNGAWWDCRHTSANGQTLRYFLFLPEAVKAGERLPLVLLLHGSSGSGDGDGRALSGAHRFATGLFTDGETQARYPSVVLAPQADPPLGETWVRVWRAPAADDPRGKEQLGLALEVMERLQGQFPVDGQRLYLVGQSMGGFGAWLSYTRQPGRFAAIVPVCGGGDASAVVASPTAVWAFHGARDRVVPVERARVMVEAIRAAGGNVRYTEYPDLDHNIFDETFAEPELLPWLFSQRLPDGADSSR